MRMRGFTAVIAIALASSLAFLSPASAVTYPPGTSGATRQVTPALTLTGANVRVPVVIVKGATTRATSQLGGRFKFRLKFTGQRTVVGTILTTFGARKYHAMVGPYTTDAAGNINIGIWRFAKSCTYTFTFRGTAPNRAPQVFTVVVRAS